MNIGIQLPRQRVKAMQRRFHEAHRRGDVRWVQRIQALLDHLVNGVAVAVLSIQWRFSPACF
jgi:hypothetical protein